jgi:hypothetical protein
VTDLPLVRLSRDRRRAVCANVDCGEPFAERREKPTRTSLAFLPGWVRPRGDGWSDAGAPGGVWVMSKRVRQRVAAGEPPSYRRHPMPEEAGNRRYRPGRLTTVPTVYPAIVICPACDLRQEVNEEALGLQ